MASFFGDEKNNLIEMKAFKKNEIKNEVMDGKQSVVWLESLNRVNVQKSIIQWCLK